MPPSSHLGGSNLPQNRAHESQAPAERNLGTRRPPRHLPRLAPCSVIGSVTGLSWYRSGESATNVQVVRSHEERMVRRYRTVTADPCPTCPLLFAFDRLTFPGRGAKIRLPRAKSGSGATSGGRGANPP